MTGVLLARHLRLLALCMPIEVRQDGDRTAMHQAAQHVVVVPVQHYLGTSVSSTDEGFSDTERHHCKSQRSKEWKLL